MVNESRPTAKGMMNLKQKSMGIFEIELVRKIGSQNLAAQYLMI